MESVGSFFLSLIPLLLPFPFPIVSSQQAWPSRLVFPAQTLWRMLTKWKSVWCVCVCVCVPLSQCFCLHTAPFSCLVGMKPWMSMLFWTLLVASLCFVFSLPSLMEFSCVVFCLSLSLCSFLALFLSHSVTLSPSSSPSTLILSIHLPICLLLPSLFLSIYSVLLATPPLSHTHTWSVC